MYDRPNKRAPPRSMGNAQTPLIGQQVRWLTTHQI